VTNKEKTEEKLISGIECSPDTAIDEMKATKELWNKTEGRQYKHFIHSFPPDEKITHEQAHELAKQLCAERFKGHEVLIATHKDADHIHSHIIVNSVNYENGYKLQWSKKDLANMKKDCNELSRQHGLSVPVKGKEITTYNQGKYKAMEKAITGDYKSYVLDCYKAVSAVKEKATSREDFIARMKEQGYETKWTDSRKHITFTDQEGNSVRNSNLEKTFKEKFGKEDLTHGFERNAETASTAEHAREQLRAVRAETAGTGSDTDHTDATVAKLEATIKQSREAVGADESARRDRIANEQSRQRERDGNKEQRTIKRSRGSQSQER